MQGPMLPAAMNSKAGGGLFCELYWGNNLSEAWSYGPEQSSVHAAPDETALLPLYGFTLPEEPFLIAERTPQGWRIHLPPAARAERSVKGDGYAALPAGDLRRAAGRTSVDLAEGMTLRLSEGQLSLRIQASVVKDQVNRLQWKDFGWLAIVSMLFLSLPVGFLVAGPTPQRMEESKERAMKMAADKEAERRKALGLNTPLRPLTEEELGAKQDAGSDVTVPAYLRVR
ncbi:hypothetical protein [Comamonas sp. JC664]|uniref:hypothetical protein n=1 Tax=Comamonas sp. JC664 TaxID=2801917 RepID=UPI00191E5CF7|nr:hypothetical protein [Comamonas sp. JC664]MBL0693791.1 hypothetical protein [Comamonas sp. JC664]GHG74417.1 hypothetical protein GCM10012319_22190 [Comamonas sp. KCTC 72670]